MKRSALAMPITALALLLGMSSAHAAEWQRGASGTQYSGDATSAAERYLVDAQDQLGLDGVNLVAWNVIQTGRSQTVRFHQVHDGVRVAGSAAAVRVGSDGSVGTVALQVSRDVAVSTKPTLSSTDAAAVVETALGYSIVTPRAPELVVWPVEDEADLLLWQLDASGADGGWRYLVDAHSGELVHQRSLAVDVLGRVWETNAIKTPDPIDVELVDLVPMTPQLLAGWGGNLLVTNYVSGSAQGGNDLVLEQKLTPNVGEDFLYDPPADKFDPTDAFAQVGIYYHLSRARNFFKKDLGVDLDADGWKVVAVANMMDGGQPMDNAFFSPAGIGAPWDAPNMIAIGQGTIADFSDDSDVFIHEFGHYVSHNAINYNGGQLAMDEYGLSPWGGGIDEGISDYFACTVNDDPILGEASLMGSSRDLTDTSKSCPAGVIGEVHADGEIIGSLGWTLREELGKPIADQLVWGATSMLPTNPSLGDFGTGLIQTAEDMAAEGDIKTEDVDLVTLLVAERGLDQCGRVLDVSEEQPRDAFLFGLDLISQALGGGGCEGAKQFGISLQSLFHFSHTPEAETQNVAFSVDVTSLGTGDLEWDIYVRKDGHVSFKPGQFLPQVNKFDYAVTGITGTTGEIVIDAASDPPFDPNATYYAVLVHRNCPNAQAVITAGEADVTSGTGGGDAAGGAAGMGGGDGLGGDGDGSSSNAAGPGDADDGCGCRVVNAPSGRGWLALVGAMGLAGMLIGRRRRRWLSS